MTMRGAGQSRLEYAGKWQGVSCSPSPSHDFTELMLMRGGRLRLRVEEAVLDGGRHTLFVVPAHSKQHKTTKGLMRSTYIFFETSKGVFDDSARAIDLSGDHLTRQWMEDLYELFHEPASSSSSSTADRLLAVLLDRLAEVDRRAGRRQVLHPALAAAVRILELETAQPVSIDVLASRAHISASRLTELFRDAYGRGPLGYQQWLRMVRARRLLRDPYLSVKEVATECGYEDANYFSRLFRKRFGCAPGAWRKQPYAAQR